MFYLGSLLPLAPLEGQDADLGEGGVDEVKGLFQGAVVHGQDIRGAGQAVDGNGGEGGDGGQGEGPVLGLEDGEPYLDMSYKRAEVGVVGEVGEGVIDGLDGGFELDMAVQALVD